MTSETFPSSERIDPATTRKVLKPLQKEGLEVEVNNGKLEPKYFEESKPNPIQDEAIKGYLNSVSHELSGVGRGSASGIIEALRQFTEDPAYVEDMVQYGPSLEDDFAAKRMERLKSVREKVTEAQMSTQPGPERIQAVKAATFVRTHLPDLGLKTTINILETLS